jgi:hypothetical protein
MKAPAVHAATVSVSTITQQTSRNFSSIPTGPLRPAW